jgi:hypothetical protein
MGTSQAEYEQRLANGEDGEFDFDPPLEEKEKEVSSATSSAPFLDFKLKRNGTAIEKEKRIMHMHGTCRLFQISFTTDSECARLIRQDQSELKQAIADAMRAASDGARISTGQCAVLSIAGVSLQLQLAAADSRRVP